MAARGRRDERDEPNEVGTQSVHVESCRGELMEMPDNDVASSSGQAGIMPQGIALVPYNPKAVLRISHERPS
jgi:hypothetical protein